MENDPAGHIRLMAASLEYDRANRLCQLATEQVLELAGLLGLKPFAVEYIRLIREDIRTLRVSCEEGGSDQDFYKVIKAAGEELSSQEINMGIAMNLADVAMVRRYGDPDVVVNASALFAMRGVEVARLCMARVYVEQFAEDDG